MQLALNIQAGDLSPREQVIADLALKISSLTTLTNGARVERLRAYNLQEEEIHEVIKLADLFNYWQQRNQATTAPTQSETPGARSHATLEPEVPLPYFFEGTLPPTYEKR